MIFRKIIKEILMYIIRVHFSTLFKMKLTLGSKLSDEFSHRRAAVVPYFVYTKSPKTPPKIYFLLGVDAKYNEITDFGGGVKQSYSESSMTAATREFREETESVFGELYDKIPNMNLTVALQNNHQSTLFVPVSGEWYLKAPLLFENSPTKKEISKLVWFSEDEFKELVSNNSSGMWTKIKRFYRDGYTQNLTNSLKLIYTFDKV